MLAVEAEAEAEAATMVLVELPRGMKRLLRPHAKFES
jgi:hypothetical protein